MTMRYNIVILLVLFLFVNCKSSRPLENEEIKTYRDSVTIRDSIKTMMHDSTVYHYKVVYDTCGRIIESNLSKVRYLDSLNINVNINDSLNSQRNSTKSVSKNSSGREIHTISLLLIASSVIVCAIILILWLLWLLWKKKHIH